MKHYAIIGLGSFGSTVVEELAQLKCRVTAIDSRKSKVQSLPDFPNVVVILGDATDRKFLENLDMDKFDGVVVSTGEDSHASILITLFLKEMGAKHIVVKANSADHAKILTQVGATQTVIPEKQMAVKLSHSLAQPNLIDFLPLAADFVVAELEPPPDFVGKRLMELKLRSEYQVQVIAVRRAEGGDITFAPGGDYTIFGSDVLIILGRAEDIGKMKG